MNCICGVCVLWSLCALLHRAWGGRMFPCNGASGSWLEHSQAKPVAAGRRTALHWDPVTISSISRREKESWWALLPLHTRMIKWWIQKGATLGRWTANLPLSSFSYASAPALKRRKRRERVQEEETHMESILLPFSFFWLAPMMSIWCHTLAPYRCVSKEGEKKRERRLAMVVGWLVGGGLGEGIAETLLFFLTTLKWSAGLLMENIWEKHCGASWDPKNVRAVSMVQVFCLFKYRSWTQYFSNTDFSNIFLNQLLKYRKNNTKI